MSIFIACLVYVTEKETRKTCKYQDDDLHHAGGDNSPAPLARGVWGWSGKKIVPHYLSNQKSV